MKKSIVLFLCVFSLLFSSVYVASAQDKRVSSKANYPVIKSITVNTDGFNIQWSKYSGAYKYGLFVFDKTGWKKVTDTKSTTYNHNNLKNNTVYNYTVRAFNKNGKAISQYYNKGWRMRFFASPKLTSVKKDGDGVTIRWNKISGINKYRVYRKTFGGKWQGIKGVSQISYTDMSCKKNTLYCYTVRSIDKNGNSLSGILTDTKYYYNGKAIGNTFKYKGTVYHFTKGHFRTGYVKLKGKGYYYNSYGVLQKNGIVGSAKEGYCYANKYGTIDYSYRNGIKYKGDSWLVLNGKAKKVKTRSDETLYRAFKELAKCTNNKMTKSEKLWATFKYVKNAYIEKNPRIPHYTGMDWPIVYANDMFIRRTGNCLSYGAAYAYMAKAIGYENVYCCHSGGHGWAEIDGLVYDPEWSRHHSEYSYYGLSYNAHTDQNYKGAIAPGLPWMHIKI